MKGGGGVWWAGFYEAFNTVPITTENLPPKAFGGP